MTKPTTWVLGNWKQNLTAAPADKCARAVVEGLADARGSGQDLEVGVAPVLTSIPAVAPHCRPTHPLWLLAQNVAAQERGAFTGEVGAAMLQEYGVQGAIVGHSERRSHFKEDDALIAAKVDNALRGGLTAVLCVGETLEARDAGDHEKTVISQLSASLARIDSSRVDARLVLAYEPVWAIGTGRTATPEQASQMHQVIRAFMQETFGEAGRDRSILYGGSVKPDNAADLMAAGDIDGFLVGGASLDPTSFLAIVRAAASAAAPS